MSFAIKNAYHFATNITDIYHCKAKAILPNKYFFRTDFH